MNRKVMKSLFTFVHFALLIVTFWCVIFNFDCVLGVHVGRVEEKEIIIKNYF